MPKASHATSWMPALGRHGGPVYLAIAEAIAADITAGYALTAASTAVLALAAHIIIGFARHVISLLSAA